MPYAIPSASSDVPYLANTTETIEQFMSSGGAPLDTACGLLATDPALLLHLLLRRADACETAEQVECVWGLRRLAGDWLDSSDHRWYASILPVCHSALNSTQREEHRRLCRRSAIAAGLIGEWSLHDLECMRTGADIAELHCVLSVFPSLLRLCRIEQGSVYDSLEIEQEAWQEEVGSYLGEAFAKAYKLSDDPDEPANIAVEIAASSVQPEAEKLIAGQMPEWSRRLSRTVEELQADLAHVSDGLHLSVDGPMPLKPERALQLISAVAELSDEERDCESCRQQAYDNALMTMRNRLSSGETTLGEVINHLMHALCNCGSIRRAHWYYLDETCQVLQSRRRKTTSNAASLASTDLIVEDIPFLQVLLERPRSLHVYPEIRQQLQELLARQNNVLFAENYLCASIFCGSTAVGVLYADADGKTIGASEVAKFKAVASLASKTLSLLALRSKRIVDTLDTSQLASPSYASFGAKTAANESGDLEFSDDLMGQR